MEIIVNGVEKKVKVATLGYSEIVSLANKETKYLPTVTYKKNDTNGSLILGEHVEVEEGMNFNVAYTGGA